MSIHEDAPAAAVTATVTGSRHEGWLRVVDRVEATKVFPAKDFGREVRWTHHLHAGRDGLYRDMNHLNDLDDPGMTWDEVLADYASVRVRRWRRAADWALLALAVVLGMAAVSGFALGGAYAVAAGVAVLFAVLGTFVYLLNYMWFERW